MMIFFDNDGEFEVVSFDYLKSRFPNTSFCWPLKQTTLPVGYILATTTPLPDDKTKKYKASLVFGEFGNQVEWIAEEFTEEEIEEKKKEILSEIEKRFKETTWAVQDDVPDAISNKYKKYRKELWAVLDQESYPFSVTYPEIE